MNTAELISGWLGAFLFLIGLGLAFVWLVFPFLVLNRAGRIVDRLDKIIARLDRMASEQEQANSTSHQWAKRTDAHLQNISDSARSRESA
jgi:hypothetical protein